MATAAPPAISYPVNLPPQVAAAAQRAGQLGNTGKAPVTLPGVNLQQEYNSPLNQANLASIAGGGSARFTPQNPYGVDPAYLPYINAFSQSLNASRAGIDKQLAQSLGELGQRRNAAAQVVAQLPGEANQSYAAAEQGLAGAGAAGAGAVSQDVAGSAGALAGPLREALAQNRGGTAAMQPFLNLANMANYQGGEALLNQQAMVGRQGIDAEQRGFLQNLLGNEIAQQQANSPAAVQRQTNQQLTSSLISHGYQTDQNTVNAVQSDPAYQRLVKLVTTGVQTPGEGGPVTSRPTGVQIDAMLQQSGKTQAWIDAIHSMHPEWFTAPTPAAAPKP